MTIPRATARLQFSRAFTLDDAVACVPYLAALGISHIYASPLLTARSGSSHGYDTIDHNAINPELGGEAALRRLAAALRAMDMGLVLDIVPNHMAVGGNDNAWWLDVLEWGRRSPYADFFDIDWQPSDPSLRAKVLAPFLGKPYARCLVDNEIQLKFDAADGRLFVAYHHHRFPVDPGAYATVLRVRDFFQDLSAAFDRLSRAPHPGARSMAADLRQHLRDRVATADGRTAMDEVLAHYDSRTAEGRQRLHLILERQHFRLCWWRAAPDRINWRRFFDVNDLAALRVDRPTVFEATHEFVLRLYAEGLIDGVRIDHVDGLANPHRYCRRLRQHLDGRGFQRPAGTADGPPYIIVEKILAAGEQVRSSWRSSGTTGYDFMNEVSAIQHDPNGEAPLTALWAGLSGRPDAFEAEAHAAKQELLTTTFSGEYGALCLELERIANSDPATRDIPPGALRRSLAMLLIHTPVYRLYSGGPLDRDDRRVLASTLRGARRCLNTADHSALLFISRLLSRPPESGRAVARQRVALRLQQLSAPLAAKAVEDTAFYRYGRLLSRNEVGASPSQFSLSPDQFHAACQERRYTLSHAMLATATHDHKRGEDVRARLAVLSEIPGEWADTVRNWMAAHAALRTRLGDGCAPGAADELMLYQMLVGAWPLELLPTDRPGMQAFADRLAAWQQKALREAKRQTSWHQPNHRYEDACRRFLMSVLLERAASRDSLYQFVSRIAAAGALNGLAQTLLRMTAPGVPDLYQGTELWDFSLVDPDNRRPVDFAMRRQLLERDRSVDALLSTWRDGALKQRLIARTLDVRRRLSAMFAGGDYLPLLANGPHEAHVVTFGRQRQADATLVLTTRLPLRIEPDLRLPVIRPDAWQDTSIFLAPSLRHARWRDAFTGDQPPLEGDRLMVRDAFRVLPVALLEQV